MSIASPISSCHIWLVGLVHGRQGGGRSLSARPMDVVLDTGKGCRWVVLECSSPGQTTSIGVLEIDLLELFGLDDKLSL